METIRLEGWQELDAKLRALKNGLGYEALKAAARAGGNIILNDMRARVPYGRGDRSKSIKHPHKRRHLRDDLKTSVSIVPNGAEATIGPKWYAFLANFFERTGAKAHRILGDPNLFIAGQGFVRSIEHPGFSKRPFMIPAFNAKWKVALEEARRVLVEKIDALIKA